MGLGPGIPGVARQRRDPLDSLWQAGSATGTSLVLIMLLVATLAVAAGFPQLPSGLSGPESERWLASTAGSYPGVGTLLRGVGVFDVTGGPWVPLLLAILAFNLLLRLAIQAGETRAAWRTVPAPEPQADATVAVDGRSPAAAPETVPEEVVPASLGAGRRRLAATAALLVYIGPLILMLGLLINAVVGWRASDIALAPKSSFALPNTDGLRISLDNISGSEAAPLSTIVLTGIAGDPRPASAGFARPAHWGNLWLAQRSTGPALAVSCLDGQGRAIPLRSLASDSEAGDDVHILFRQAQSEQGVDVPARNLTLRAVSYAALPEKGIEAPVFLVEVYRGDESAPLLSQLVENEGSIAVDGITCSLRRDRHAILEVAYLPGILPMLLGALLALVGAIMAVVWGRADGHEPPASGPQ